MEDQRARSADAIRGRPDVAASDVDDLVAIAAELQQMDLDAAPTATVGEVTAVARELDIDPKYVDAAIGELGRRRAASAEAARAAAAAAAAAAARTRARLRTAAGAAAGTLALGLVVVGGLGWSGANTVRAARLEAEGAERALSVVVHRQEALAPQVLGHAIEPGPSAPIEAELAAADALARTLSEGLAALPDDPASAQGKLNLQHEVTGAQNRIGVERQRWEAARATLAAAEAGLPGRVAIGLGWVR